MAIDESYIFHTVNLESKLWRPGFFQKRNAGIILCTENYPSVRFLEESRTPFFFRDLPTVVKNRYKFPDQIILE